MDKHHKENVKEHMRGGRTSFPRIPSGQSSTSNSLVFKIIAIIFLVIIVLGFLGSMGYDLYNMNVPGHKSVIGEFFGSFGSIF